MKKNLARTGLTALIFSALGGFCGWSLQKAEVTALEKQVEELQNEEKRSAIISSVSKQLGEIASDQQKIAEEKTVDALRQKLVADSMRQISEQARLEAEEAERNAKESERQANEQRQEAENQRLTADRERSKAESSERLADTLRYVALGRSLGATSLQTDDEKLAQLLAYYSYHFTQKYGNDDDLYYHSVLQSLMNTSHSRLKWNKHKGMMTGIDFMPKGDNRIVSVSNYGEIFIHKKVGNKLITQRELINDKRYDFRHVYVSRQGIIYAISRSGHLVTINWNDREPRISIFPVPQVEKPFSMNVLDDQKVIVIGERQLAMVDTKMKTPDKAVIASKTLDFQVKATCFYQGKSYLIDEDKKEYCVRDLDHMEYQGQVRNIVGAITAHTYNDKGLKVYGTLDGTIYLFKKGMKTPIKLIGHRSRISRVKLYDDHLFSSSYDGKVIFWNTNSDKIEPMEIFSENAWIPYFTRDNSNQSVWFGDQYGNVIEALLNVKQMKDVIEAELKKSHTDFNRDEWNYYIGKNEPYRPLIMPQGKEDKE